MKFGDPTSIHFYLFLILKGNTMGGYLSPISRKNNFLKVAFRKTRNDITKLIVLGGFFLIGLILIHSQIFDL